MKHLNSLNKYFIKYKWHLISGFLFVIISNIFNVMQAPLVRKAIDAVAEQLGKTNFGNQINAQNDLYHRVFIFALLILGVALVKGVFMYLMRQSIIVMSRRIEYDQKNEIFDHYQRLTLSFYRRNNTGDLMNRISEDVSRVRMYVGPAIMYSINLVVMFVLVISKMFAVNSKMALLVLLPLPILSITIYLVNSIIYKKSDALQMQLSNITTFAQEAFSGIRVLRSFGAENKVIQAFEQESENYRTKALDLAKTDALFFPMMMLLIGLSNLLTIYIGGVEVIKGNISYGNIAEFVIYVNMLTWPVASLGWVTSLVQRAAASQQRINTFLDEAPELKNENLKDGFNFKNHIDFEQVTYQYDSHRKPALKSLSFTIEKGKTIAFVGTTGSGKSTIAALLLRMIDPSAGKITIDNTDLKALNLDAYRKQIGYVPQDVFLFSDSIAENIAFGLEKDSYKKEDLEEASKKASVYENISQFPSGFETLLGERGVTLSGGQKQRVAIARALVKKPEILILDDCLSAVDMETEAAILKEFKKEFENKTVILISHRISSVKNADRIIVLSDGEIIESGTHEELITKHGHYAHLNHKQSLTEEISLAG